MTAPCPSLSESLLLLVLGSSENHGLSRKFVILADLKNSWILYTQNIAADLYVSCRKRHTSHSTSCFYCYYEGYIEHYCLPKAFFIFCVPCNNFYMY
ncbi:hypothetical protein CDAR_456821 [Caerostris darwini]|uniref:Secreted protein n=1 Tax=Caerostris darwini TaxID=1538125 RepID=A0AAV4TLS9_9ARAC|nr:hypothetical protein CDAR_456821 [Caerostris darwini]